MEVSMNIQKCVYLFTLIFCMLFHGLPATFAGIPEPGIIYYGKVLDQNQSLLTDGVLNLTLSTQSGSNCVTITTKLKEITDADNTYSYSVLIPVETALPEYPAADHTLPFLESPAIYYRAISIQNTDIQMNDTISFSSDDIGTAQLLNIRDDDTDSDMDGIPDKWEYAHFENLTTANAYSDFDRDGYLDKIEFELSDTYDLNGNLYDPVTPNAPDDTHYIAYHLDIDGNGDANGGTDGLLLFRFLSGKKGDPLVKGVVSNNCSRCTIEDIETYLNIIKSTILDVDGNGVTDGATDGLLLIRYLFENRGENLTQDIETSDCIRCTAEEIEQYLHDIK